MKEKSARVKFTAADGSSEEIVLSHDIPGATAKLGLDKFFQYVVGAYQNPAIDLIRIASFVYLADTSFTRGGATDVWQQQWSRTFKFRIPLLEPERWDQPTVKQRLIECLRFLTGDEIDFTFSEWSQAGRQEFLKLFSSANEGIGADSVCLFSGGLDSLCAFAQLKEKRKTPLLISHRSNTRLMSARTELLDALKTHKGWNAPAWAVEVRRVKTEARERSRRSRAFLFAALGAAAALSLGVSEVFLCDNGIVSLNLPFSRLTVGTALTRSTHPKFIALFNDMLSELGFSGLRLCNSLLHFTKADVILELKRLGLEDLIPLTESCARPHMTSALKNHCGTCSQCLDRRIATEFAGLSSIDDPKTYQKDMFTDALTPDDLPLAEGLVRWAGDMADMSADRLIAEVPTVMDAVTEDEPLDAQLLKLHELHLRHANQVLTVMGKKFAQYVPSLAQGTLPDTCLLRISAGTRKSDIQKFVNQLNARLASLTTVFRSKRASNEKEVQDAVDALIKSQENELRRENPTIRFATKNYKPDFAAALFDLSIEVKFPRATRKLSGIIDEMGSDVNAHRKAGKHIIFIVYDPEKAITSDDEFRRDFEEFTPIQVLVTIIR